MKKFTGHYTSETGKTLKGSERLFCRVTEDGDIYISNGFVLYKMNPLEYAATVQPVTCCDAGNWEMNRHGKHEDDGTSFDLPKYFADAVNGAAAADTLERCPLTLQADKTPAACYYNAAADFAAIYNAKYIAALTPCATLRAAGPVSGAVAYSGDEPFAVVLPIRPKPEATRAIKAYFTDATANNAAELIVSRFADLDGVTATIKGAQTAAPVVWLSGDTERHADAIKAAGAKWSNKKSAYYVRVA